MANKAVLYGEDYLSHFNAKAYLETYYSKSVFTAEKSLTEVFTLKKMHEFYTETAGFASHSASILEFGGGAVVSHLISAAPYASRIVLTDYTPAWLEALDSWKRGDPQAHNWGPFFDYVVRVLEQNPHESAAEKRAKELKARLCSLLPCDVHAEKPIGDGYDRSFDVVSSSLCLETACSTHDEFREAVRKLAGFLKTEGWFVLNGGLEERCYAVGKDTTFFSLPLTKDIIKEALENAGIELVDFEILPRYKGNVAAFHAVGQLK
ncbi:nicotinamide N-methyltransferase-like [Oscarella lobularis]|uniref:nicotinamide N-methyltransferase-like n=1 Tax=Oscarella lobularis TaxID=121494 RepID=UPI003313AA19